MGNIVNHLKQIESHYRQMVSPLLQMQKQMQGHARSVASQINMTQEIQYVQKQIEQAQATFEAIKKLKISNIKVLSWLMENSWPPLLYVSASAPAKLMNHCINDKMDEKSIRRLLDNEIVGFHNSDMIKKTVLQNWDDSLISKKRMKILRSAAQAHIDKKYELSVPVLLSQLDGMSNEYFNYSTNSIRDRAEYFASHKTVSKDEFMELVFQYLKSIVFAGIDNNNGRLMEINRHKILHGVYLNYDKESVSLKLILIIDILITYPKFVSLPHAKVYHVPCCPSYQRASKNNKKKHRMIHTKISASANGLKPCGRCLKTAEK